MIKIKDTLKKVINIYETPTMIDGKKNKKQINGAQVAKILKSEIQEDKDIFVVALSFPFWTSASTV